MGRSLCNPVAPTIIRNRYLVNRSIGGRAALLRAFRVVALQRGDMTHEITAEPIKIGYLMDFLLSDDHPKVRWDDLTIKEALERVKILPAASGSPGNRVSFGNWTRRAWMGAGYLVARQLDADGVNSHLVDRFGEE
jgi:hypothetical protein